MLSASSLKNNPHHIVMIAGFRSTLGELRYRGWDIAFEMQRAHVSPATYFRLALEHNAFNGLIVCQCMYHLENIMRETPLVFEATYFGPRNGLQIQRIAMDILPSFEPMGDFAIRKPETAMYEDLSPFTSQSKGGLIIPKASLNDVKWHLDAIREIQRPDEEEFRRLRLKGAEHKTEFKLVSVG